MKITKEKKEKNKEKKKRPSRQERRTAKQAAKAEKVRRFRIDSRFPFIHRNRVRAVREEHFIRVSGATTDVRRRMLIVNIASMVVLGAAMSSLAVLTDLYELIPFVLPGTVLFGAYTIFSDRLSKKARLITIGIITLLLLVALAILWNYLKDGAKLAFNELFSLAEEFQAYVYTRYNPGNAGTNHPEACMYIFTAWASMVIGLIAAVFPFKYRRAVNVVVFVAAAAIIAYYGIVPDWSCLTVLTAALLISLCNGRIAPSWPLILLMAVVFGALILIDPGELTPVSRANENLRDRFAYKTAYMIDYEQYATGAQNETAADTEQDDMSLFNESKLPHLSKKAKIVIFAGLLLLALIIAATVIYLRISRRRASNREGIDSEDPVIAVRAMFPYSMRWLRLYGIKIANAPYSELMPQIESKMPGPYVERFKEMNELWEQAAFSDHKITEKDLDTMDEFMEDTIEMTREKLRLKDRILARTKYAL